MSLLDLKRYLVEVKMASITTLSAYFKRDADILRCMLSHWIRKGQVRCLIRSPSCGSCTKCGSLKLELYEWVV